MPNKEIKVSDSKKKIVTIFWLNVQTKIKNGGEKV